MQRGAAEIEARATQYGLKRFRWPDPYPANSLTAMRAAVWADGHGCASDFAKAAFGLAFEEGIDLTQRSAVLQAARRASLDHEALDASLHTSDLKNALEDANDHAIADEANQTQERMGAGPRQRW